MQIKLEYKFLFIIIIQLGAIGFLANKILFNRVNILGKQVVNPIQEKNIIYPNAELKHFYEPKPNGIINDKYPFSASYTINSDALNERYEYEVKKRSDVFRIITLGDSFTYGSYMDTKDNWTELLEDQLNTQACQHFNRVEVINLGVPGYDIQYTVERYKNRGSKYDPDLVLWLLKLDDVFHINEIMMDKEEYYREMMKKTGEYQRYVDQGNVYPSWERAMQDMMNEYGQSQLLNVQEQFLNNFRKQYKNKLLMISFENESKDVQQFLKEYSKKDLNNYYFNSLSTIFTNENLYFKNDHHPTIEGHKSIAKDIYTYIKRNNLIGCELN